MLIVTETGTFGYIDTQEELERIAELLGKKLAQVTTKEGVGDAIILSTTTSDHYVTTFVAVGSFVSIDTRAYADTGGVQGLASSGDGKA